MDIQETIRELIPSYGHFVMGVFDHEGKDPSFAYTIGLAKTHGHELIVIGMRPENAKLIFNTLALDHLKKGPLPIGVPVDGFANMPCVFHECTPELAAPYVVQATVYHGAPVRFLQLVIPDKAGKFPEDPNFDHAYMDHRQPLLYRLNLH